MPSHDSPSPARRPLLVDRNSSAPSVSKGSPNSGHPIKPHPPKKHMAHAVSHHRHSHGRIPSYNKNLNKLSKTNANNPNDSLSHQKHHSRTKSQTPTSSPTTQHIKRNSSNLSLVNTGSKISLKGNPSTSSLKHNGSRQKLGHITKPQPQSQPPSRNGSSHELPLRGKVKFSVGEEEDREEDRDEDRDEDEDDEWVEASSSQSPNTPKQTSQTAKAPQLEEPPSPDEPPGHSSPILPHSPPQSPPTDGSRFPSSRSTQLPHTPYAQYSRPPDAEIVTHRLLNRHRPHNVAPQMSSISATVTPSGSSGSPAFNHNHDSTVSSDLSMPADGISRFLNPTGSSSGSATPGSVSQLQSAIANIHRNHQHDQDHASKSPILGNNIDTSRRAKSASNLTTPHLANPEDDSSLPPSPQVSAPNNTRASPFKSAHEPREAAKSFTQLKLDLQRMSTNRELAQAPALQPPLTMMHGAHAAASMAGAIGERSSERRIRQWEQAALEFRNGRRFDNMLIRGVHRLEKRRQKKKVPRIEREEDKNRQVDVAGGKPASRGRVRFEVGRREGEYDEEEDEGGGVQGLLKRIWEANIAE